MYQNRYLFLLKKTYIFVLLALIYIPLIVIVFLSFVSPSEKGNIVVNDPTYTFDNYLNLFKNNEFVNGLINSIIIGIVVTPISIIFAILTCLGIWHNSKLAKSSVNFISKMSLSAPDITIGVSLIMLFSIAWLPMGLDLGFFTIILSHISFCTPYAIITLYPKFSKIPRNLIYVSNDLGYNNFRTFFNVILPYVMVPVLSGCLIVFSLSFDDFIITNLVKGSVETLPTNLYLMRKGIKSWAITFGAIFIMFIFIVMIFISIYKIRKHRKSNLLKIRIK